MFSIKTKSLELKLEVVPVETLCLHEKTLQHKVNELILEFKNWANLQNPIIVDENNMVLDGNHRSLIFNKLKFKYILVCKIDYLHERVKLRYWFRLLEDIESRDLMKQIVEDMGGKFQQANDGENLKSTLEDNRLCCGIQHGNFFASIRFKEDIVYDAISAYEVLEKIQDRLARRKKALKYIPCQYAYESGFCHELKSDDVVIWTPQITKEMVVEAAKERKLFAPKSTRHLIPARPLNVNVPTRWFKEDISLEEINKRISQFLESKNLKRFGPGQIIDGRYYEEELFVFFSKKPILNR